MKFNSQKPIFLQIRDMILDQLLNNNLDSGNRISSVREMGAILQVNPNTVQRAYTELQSIGIITQQRGVGYFITEKARGIALEVRKNEFLQIELPLFIHQMNTLGLSWEDVAQTTRTSNDKGSK